LNIALNSSRPENEEKIKPTCSQRIAGTSRNRPHPGHLRLAEESRFSAVALAEKVRISPENPRIWPTTVPAVYKALTLGG
jgi:hypothetical protein